MPDPEAPKPKQENQLKELNLRVRRQRPAHDDEDAPASRRGRDGGYFEGASSIFDAEGETGIEEEPEETTEPPQPAPSSPEPAPNAGNEPDAPEAASPRSAPNVKKVRIPGLEEALRCARGQFQNQNFEECIRLLNDILMVDPGNSEAYGLLNETQAAWEEEKQQKEWLLHLQNLRREALKLWEEKRFEECLSKYKVLNQSDPENKEFKRLLALCEEELQKKQEAAAAPSPPAPVSSRVPVYPDKVHQPGKFQSPSEISAPPVSRPPKPSQPAAEDLFGRDLLFGEAPIPPAPTPLSPNGQEPKLNSKADPSELVPPPIRLRRELPAEPNWKNIAIGVAGGILFLLILAFAYKELFPPKVEISSLRLNSQPEGAIIKIKDLITAQTPLYLGAIAPGHYQATLEKEGYKPQNLMIDVLPGKPWEKTYTLEESRFQLASLPNPEDNRSSLAASQMAGTERTGKAKKSGETGKKPINPQQAKVQAARDQLSSALNAGILFPPAPGNALDELRQLERLSPDDPLAKEASEKIQGALLSQVSRKIQSRSWEEARSLLREFQANFPESPEFRTLRDALRSEEAKLQDQKNTLIQRTESAYAAGRYVTPANDNVVALASRVLSLEPQNHRMMSLKRDSLLKAAAVASERVKRWQYDEAHTLYQALLNLSSSESNFPLDIPQLKGEAEKTEFRSFSVIHDHALVGSCPGKLRLNGYVISYVPAGDSRDGFIERISEIQQIEKGDKLKLRIAERPYRFQADKAESKEDNRQKIQQIYQELRRLAPAAR